EDRKKMGKTSTKIQPVPHEEHESLLGAQRYLNLFERLSMLIGCGDSSPADIGERACDLIAELLDVAACSLTLLSEDGSSLLLLAATHIPHAEWPKTRMTVAGGIYEPIVCGRESRLIRDRKEFERYFQR